MEDGAIVRGYIGEVGLPSCEQALVDGEEVDVPGLWRSLKNLLLV